MSNVDQRVAAMRRFNRFYTQKIGVLHDRFLRTPFSLAEGRVLYELAHREEATASEMAADLGLDPGYLSRILRGFQKQRLVTRETSRNDGRKTLLTLTEKGEKAFANLNAASKHGIGALLQSISSAAQDRLVHSMQTIESLLG